MVCKLFVVRKIYMAILSRFCIARGIRLFEDNVGFGYCKVSDSKADVLHHAFNIGES